MMGFISDRKGIITICSCLLLLVMAAAPAMSAGGKVHTVKIKDFNFFPPEVIINEGDTVEWVNEMTYGHWVISGDDMKHDNRFFSPLLLKGHKFRHTFKNPVVQDYYCPIHTMQGRITVLEIEKKPAKGKAPAETEKKKKKRRRRARD